MSKHKKKTLEIVKRRLGRENAWGLACQFKHNHKKYLIELDPRNPPKIQMTTLLHELLHIYSDFTMSETKITNMSRFLGKYMWEQGFRKVEL